MVRQCVQLASLLTLLGASPLFASGPTGTITGTITDPSGAVVPKARVIVRNEVTNATRDAETNEDGDYTAAVLPQAAIASPSRACLPPLRQVPQMVTGGGAREVVGEPPARLGT